jgi:hypothetical protein
MSEEKTVTKKEAKKRQRRKDSTPINGMRMKLQVSGTEPGFHYAWINDENVGTALDNDYEFVTHAVKIGHKHIDVSEMQGSKISRNVGNGVVAYLMRIPEEWYQENELENQKYVDFTEKQLYVESNSNGLSGTIVSDKDAWAQSVPDLKYKA